MEEVIDADELLENQFSEFDKNVNDLRIKSRELFEREFGVQYVEFMNLDWIDGLNARLYCLNNDEYNLIISNKIDFLDQIRFGNLKTKFFLSKQKNNWTVIDFDSNLCLKYLTNINNWVFTTSDASLLTQFIKDNNISVGCSYHTKVNLENKIDDILNLYRSCFDEAPKINIKCVDSITL